MRSNVLSALAAALVCACHIQNGPQPTPGPDVGTGGGGPLVDAGQASCESVCAHLAALSCPDGNDVDCVKHCLVIVSDTRFSPTPEDAQRFLDCRLNAKTQADAQSCGPASCRR